MKEFVFWKESVMLTQKFLRTWQIYLSLTYYSSLLEASVTDSSSNLSDAHVGDVMVEAGLQPPLQQLELPYFNQPCCCAPAGVQNLLWTGFRVFLSFHEYSRSRRWLPRELLSSCYMVCVTE